MKRFDREKLKEGDILCGRNMVSKEGALIRAILGSSVTNHNALVIKYQGKLCIGDMFPPHAQMVPLSHYENLVEKGDYYIRMLRIKGITHEEQLLMSMYWLSMINGTPYSERSLKALAMLRIWNSLPWKLKGKWCTRVIGIVCKQVFLRERNPFRKIFVPGMPLKRNETPRTVERRLFQGILEDVTDEVFPEKTGK